MSSFQRTERVSCLTLAGSLLKGMFCGKLKSAILSVPWLPNKWTKENGRVQFSDFYSARAMLILPRIVVNAGPLPIHAIPALDLFAGHPVGNTVV